MKIYRRDGRCVYEYVFRGVSVRSRFGRRFVLLVDSVYFWVGEWSGGGLEGVCVFISYYVFELVNFL